MNTIIIRGRRWFSRTYGNTYNTVSVEVDGVEVATLAPEYGYGDYYLQRSADWLEKHGYLSSREHYHGGVSEALPAYCRRVGISLIYYATDVKCKRDL